MNRELHDGRADGLTPLKTINLSEVDSFVELVDAMSHTAFGGRQLGEALSVLGAMINDRECQVVLTLSGAMTVAKQGKIICDMIDRGWVSAIVSTGALIAHGLTEVHRSHPLPLRHDPVRRRAIRARVQSHL